MREIVSWFLRLSRPKGFHVIVHSVPDQDGMVFVIDEYTGRKPLSRYAVKTQAEASLRACELVANPVE